MTAEKDLTDMILLTSLRTSSEITLVHTFTLLHIRLTLEGVELQLFSDMDEVLSSPVRDLSHGLARLTAGEAALQLDHYSDGSAELRASLQSLLVEDIRPDPTVVIKRYVNDNGFRLGGELSWSVRSSLLFNLRRSRVL